MVLIKTNTCTGFKRGRELRRTSYAGETVANPLKLDDNPGGGSDEDEDEDDDDGGGDDEDGSGDDDDYDDIGKGD